MRIQPVRSRAAASAVLLTLLMLTAWSCRRGAGAGAVYQMGERVQVGPLIYNVLEAEWKAQLGDPAAPRLPAHRFLVVRVSVTNSGPADSGIPAMTLVAPKGETYPELTEGEGVDQWLGMLRRAAPAMTEQGSVLFDAPPGPYRLRVSEEGELDKEKTALIDIPFRLDEPQAPTSTIPNP